MGKVIHNALGKPFSSWLPADKFEHVLFERYPVAKKNLVKEYQFDPNRKWRFDYAWPAYMLAVEIDGFGGGHQTPKAMARDNEKANGAMDLGWTLYRYCSAQLGSKLGVELAVEQVARTFLVRGISNVGEVLGTDGAVYGKTETLENSGAGTQVEDGEGSCPA